MTRGELQQFAQRRIAELMRLERDWDDDGGLPPSARSAQLAIAVTTGLLNEDNLATPQISPDGSGGVDIEWLVGGRHLSASASKDGALVMWAVDAAGEEVFSFDSAIRPVEREAFMLVFKQAQVFLHEMSSSVRRRIPLR